jgi:hypothetical protein
MKLRPKVPSRYSPGDCGGQAKSGVSFEQQASQSAAVGAPYFSAIAVPVPRANVSAMSIDRTEVCPQCHRPMKLVRTIPALGAAWPALLVFYCQPCKHADTQEDGA